MAESLTITSVPDNKQPGTKEVKAQITTEQQGTEGNFSDVDILVSLIVNGQQVQQKDGTGESGDSFTVTFDYGFLNPGEYDIIVRAFIDYTLAGFEEGDIDAQVEDSATATIREEQTNPFEDDTSENYASAFNNRSETIIENITTDDGIILTFDIIDFEPYSNPTISVDSSARFAVHNILGGTTVRQKIGEKPREVTVNGVCTETVVGKINQLNKAKLVSLNSDVIGDVIRCQVASTSTDPIDDGGAVDMDGGEFLYNFSISLVEVGRPQTGTQ